MHGRPAPQEPGEPRESHPQRWHILGVLILALLVTSIDHTVINVALPRLVTDLRASSAQLQWVVAAYTIVFAGLLLTAGSLGDRFGRRRALLAGLSMFLGGSVLAALSTSTTMLIAARGVMGVGGALIMPTTLSILVNAFGSPRERAKAIAAWTAASGAGIALGPIVGGLLMRSFTWSSVFWINIPLLTIALLGTLHLVPESRDPKGTRLDPIGALLSIIAVGTIVYAIIEGPSRGWTSSVTLGAFGIGAAVSATFVAWELHRDEPMLDLGLFRNPAFSAASIALAMLFFAMAGAVFLQAQYLQFILSYTPLAAGFALVPAAIGMMLGTGAGAHLASHLGGRVAVTAGTLVAGVGLAIQAGFIDGTSYVPTGLGLFLFGVGAGMAMPSATDLIMATLPPARAGVGSAVNDTVRELGGALGVAIIGSVAATRYTSSMRTDLAGFRGLSGSTISALGDNVGADLGARAHLGSAGSAIDSLARHAFVNSMTTALWIAVGMAVAATLIAFAYLPRHRSVHAATPYGPGGHGVHHHDARHEPARALTAVRRSSALLVLLALVAVGCGRTNTVTAIPPRPHQSTTTSQARPSAPVDALVPVRGARLHIRCAGSGTVTVMLMSGFESDGDDWAKVSPTVEQRARVCSYARFGNGTSDPPPSTQTFTTQARDLRTGLRSIGEFGPYVVVGHSFGGAEAVTFTSMFRTDVRGLMLVDASPVTWQTMSCSVADDGSPGAQEFHDSCATISSAANNPEHLDGTAAFADVAKIDALGDVPMIVTTAAHHSFGLGATEEARLNQAWDTGQRYWLSLSTSAHLVPVDNTSHHIQIDRPDVVVGQIMRLLP